MRKATLVITSFAACLLTIAVPAAGRSQQEESSGADQVPYVLVIVYETGSGGSMVGFQEFTTREECERVRTRIADARSRDSFCTEK
jgi:hypothetical protein